MADVLRSRLGQVNWGRSELGLPLLDGEKTPIVSPQQHQTQQQQLLRQQAQQKQLQPPARAVAHAYASHSDSGSEHANDSISTQKMGDGAPTTGHSVLNIEYDGPTSSRRPLMARVPPVGANDSDDNKYKKRSPSEIFQRWSR